MPEIKKKIIFISNGPMIASIIYVDLEVPLERGSGGEECYCQGL